MKAATAPGDIYAGLLLDLLAGRATQPLVIGVTSAERGEGRSRLAQGLAETLAANIGSPTVLIELDFERPVLATTYGLKNTMGLAEVTLDEAMPGEALHEVADNLWLMPIGNTASRPLKFSARLLEDGLPIGKITAALRQTSPKYNSLVQQKGFVAVLDLPPLAVATGPQLAGLASDLVLAVRAHSTSSNSVKAALARLDETGHRSKLTRSVLVGLKPRTPRWLARLT